MKSLQTSLVVILPSVAVIIGFNIDISVDVQILSIFSSATICLCIKCFEKLFLANREKEEKLRNFRKENIFLISLFCTYVLMSTPVSLEFLLDKKSEIIREDVFHSLVIYVSLFASIITLLIRILIARRRDLKRKAGVDFTRSLIETSAVYLPRSQ